MLSEKSTIAVLLEQKRYFDAMLQLGPMLDGIRTPLPEADKADEVDCLSAMVQCLYALNMGMLADAYAIRLVELLHKRGDTEKALIAFNEAFKHHADGASLYLHAGDLMQKLSRLDDAVRCFNQVLTLDPWNAVAFNNRANVYRQQKKIDLALSDYQASLAINPLYAEALNNIGNLYKDMGRDNDAEKSYQSALEIKPAFLECKNNYAILMQETGRYDESIALLQQIVAERPDYKSAWLNMGGSLMRQARYADAETCYVKALEVDNNYTEARFNLGMCQMSQKKAAQGFANYESRYQRSPLISAVQPPKFPIPRWTDESIAGKQLLIWPEQGLGDQIMCITYVRALREVAKPSRVVLVCARSLVSLFSRVAGIDQVVAKEDSMPLCDYWTCIMSVPHHLYRLGGKLSAPLPYLTADKKWLNSTALPWLNAPVTKIGLCWKGSPGFASDHLRSFALSLFNPLLSVDAVRYATLLPSTREEFLTWAGAKALDIGHEIDAGTPAFEETAALIEQLDLVITSDTSVAHLSIALGKPTWLLLSFAGEWRWDIHPMADHPALRIFRQSVEGDWSTVITDVVGALTATENVSAAAPLEMARAGVADKNSVSSATGAPVKKQRGKQQ